MLILGLDISKTSGGFSLFDVRGYSACVHSIDVDKSDENRFIRCFNSLKDFISANYSGYEFDLVLVEDIFFESNVDTYRMLSVLNLCIDHCVSEGVLKTKEYLKVSNKTWKSWLFCGDDLKGLGDKERIRLNVLSRGVSFDGQTGYQDMYDATGMIMGYLQRDEVQQKEKKVKQKQKYKLSDVECLYCLFKEELEDKLRQRGIQEEQIEYFKLPRISEKSLLGLFDGESNCVHVSRSKVNLGGLVEDLGVSAFVGGGWLACWLKGGI